MFEVFRRTRPQTLGSAILDSGFKGLLRDGGDGREEREQRRRGK